MATSATQALGGGSPLTPPPNGLDAVMKDVEALKAKPHEAAAKAQADLEQAQGQRDSQLEAIHKARAEVGGPPAFTPPPMPKAEQTDPRKAWGSSAMLLALFASAFTRNKMNTALNAAAGVLKAYHEGDVAKATQQFQQWKISNENAIKASEFQQKQYQEILGQLDKRENFTRQEYDSQVRTVQAELRAQAAAFGDDRMIAALELGGVKAANQFAESQRRATQQLQLHAGDLEKQQATAEAVHALRESPEFKKATPIQQLALLAKVSPSHADLTPAQRDNLTLRMRKDLDTQGVGKPFQELQNKWPIIADAEQQLAKNGQLNAQTSAALVDGFQRIYNNQAVRIGLVKLNTEHAPYLDQLALEASRWQAGGGGVLAPQQARDMLALMHEYRDNLGKLRDVQLSDYRETAQALGLDPNLVANPRYHPSTVDHQTQQVYAAPLGLRQNPQAVISHGVGVPVQITSGKRTDEENARAGGSPTSEHLSGQAWDFVPQGISMEDAGKRLYDNMRAAGQNFDQIEITPTHVHIGFGPKNRNEIIHVGTGGKAHGGAQYADADAVRAAFKSGKISRDDATRILQNQFGYQ